MKRMEYEGGDKTLSVRIPYSQWKRAKTHAQVAGMSMSKLISVSLENEMERVGAVKVQSETA